ncbi:hypothetical protein PIB30_064125, partial [Stylosanthes scabra]|nr:hypothetical protein [Stylosanthes scabra]
MWGSLVFWVLMFCSGRRKEVIFKCKYLTKALKRADSDDQSLERRGWDLQGHSDAQ